MRTPIIAMALGGFILAEATLSMPDSIATVLVSLLGGSLIAMGGWHLTRTISHTNRITKLETSFETLHESLAEIKRDVKRLVQDNRGDDC